MDVLRRAEVKVVQDRPGLRAADLHLLLAPCRPIARIEELAKAVCRLLHLRILLAELGRVPLLLDAVALIGTVLHDVVDGVQDVLDHKEERFLAELATVCSRTRDPEVQLARYLVQGVEELGERTFGSDATVERDSLIDKGRALAEEISAGRQVCFRQPALQAHEAERRGQE